MSHSQNLIPFFFSEYFQANYVLEINNSIATFTAEVVLNRVWRVISLLISIWVRNLYFDRNTVLGLGTYQKNKTVF